MHSVFWTLHWSSEALDETDDWQAYHDIMLACKSYNLFVVYNI